jgi:dGTP triphosphohydrolase
MRSKLPTFNEFIKENKISKNKKKINEELEFNLSSNRAFSEFDIDDIADAVADNVKDDALEYAMKDAADEFDLEFENDLMALLDAAEDKDGGSLKEKVMKHVIETAEMKDSYGIEGAAEELEDRYGLGEEDDD